MQDDIELLRRYARDRSEAAFTELVQRNLLFVYSTAIRQVGGSHRAEDVVQAVFTDLARKAGSVSLRSDLTGWLYISTHFAAAKLKRTERRRQDREEAAHAMQQLLSCPTPEIDWEHLRPVLDDAMRGLNSRDRETVLLRFFKQLPFAEVGRRLGLSEDAARMRLDRTLDKLRHLLARRGITSTSAAALAATLASQPIIAAPASLAATISHTALAGAVASTGGTAIALKFLNLMSTTKATLASVTLLTLAVAFSVYEGRQERQTAQRLASASNEVATWKKRAGDAERAALEFKKEADGLDSQLTIALASQNASLNFPKMDARAMHLEQLKLLVHLRDQNQIGVTLSPILNNKVFDGFSQLFDLTEAEAETLNNAVQEIRNQLEQLSTAGRSVSFENNAIVVKIDAVGEGQAIHDRLMKVFESTLGPERFTALQSLLKGTTPDTIEQAFQGFGAATRTVTIRHVPPERSSGGMSFRVDDMTRGGGRTTFFTDPAVLPENLLWLTFLAPQISELQPPAQPTAPPSLVR